MKNSIRIIIWSVVALVLAALLVILLVKPSLLPVPRINLPRIAHLTYDDAARYTAGSGSASGITAVDIEWLDGAVEIVPCEGTEASFAERSAVALDEKESLHWYNENGTLHIRYGKAGISLTDNLNKVLTLHLPKDVTYTQLDVDSVSGEITVGELAANEVDLETVSGNITLDRVTGHSLDLNAISGRIDGTVTFNKIDSETTSGSLTLACLTAPREIDANTVSGDTELRLPEDAGFTAKLDTVSGDFNSDFPIVMRDKAFIAGDGAVDIDMESVSGDLAVLPLQ